MPISAAVKVTDSIEPPTVFVIVLFGLTALQIIESAPVISISDESVNADFLVILVESLYFGLECILFEGLWLNAGTDVAEFPETTHETSSPKSIP